MSLLKYFLVKISHIVCSKIPYYFITSILITFFSCTCFQEKAVSRPNDSDRVIKNDTEEIVGIRIYSPMEIARERDSIKRVKAERLPVSCSYEYREDIDFNKYIIISLKNNTKEIINSVQINIKLTGSGNQLIEELKKRVTINPGQTQTIKYITDNYVDDIFVLKYYGIKSGVQYNGIDNYDKVSLELDDMADQVKKRNSQQ